MNKNHEETLAYFTMFQNARMICCISGLYQVNLFKNNNTSAVFKDFFHTEHNKICDVKTNSEGWLADL